MSISQLIRAVSKRARTGRLLLTAAGALGLVAPVSCKRAPSMTSETICRDLEREGIAEKCEPIDAAPLFTVPRKKSQWMFLVAAEKERSDPILGTLPKPEGYILQFESLEDLEVALERLKGARSALPILPIEHRIEKPPTLILFPAHENALVTRATLERLYGYSK